MTRAKTKKTIPGDPNDEEATKEQRLPLLKASAERVKAIRRAEGEEEVQELRVGGDRWRGGSHDE
jgi:hypothetical protein